ncbi:SUMO ligase siz1 [Puttea exsequens]|nr:SUMO ligase siz1 [Puttea exsequens]
MATPGPANPETVSVKVKTLINSQLKQILKKEGLLVSGAKATLQSRIIDRESRLPYDFAWLHQYARHNDIEGFNRLRSLVYNPDADLSNLSPSPSTNQVYQNHPPLPPVKLHPPSFYNNPLRSGVSVAAPPISGHGSGSRAPQFKSSPFYSVLEPLTSVLECKASVRETTRDTVEATINLRAKIAESLSSDPNVRVMIYCAADAMSPFSRVDIEFPHQIEIKVNQDEVKANLRGLKNKPGTTRPADITYMLRHKAGYNNHMVVIYALTKKVRYWV